MINWTFFSQLLKGHCHGNQFCGPNQQNWPTSPSVIALLFHSGLENCSVDGHINTSDRSSTPDINLVCLDPVTLEMTLFISVPACTCIRQKLAYLTNYLIVCWTNLRQIYYW